jgi:hypothetical protein
MPTTSSPFEFLIVFAGGVLTAVGPQQCTDI